jgi:hypothetical protein
VSQWRTAFTDTAVHANDRQGLERLCRYGARGPVCFSVGESFAIAFDPRADRVFLYNKVFSWTDVP